MKRLIGLALAVVVAAGGVMVSGGMAGGDDIVGKVFVCQDGINTYRFTPTLVAGLAATNANSMSFDLSRENPGRPAVSVRSKGVRMESSAAFYYVAYLANGNQIGTTAIPVKVDTAWGDPFSGLHGDPANANALIESCYATLYAELDSLWVREGAATDTVHVAALY